MCKETMLKMAREIRGDAKGISWYSRRVLQGRMVRCKSKNKPFIDS